MSQNELFLPCDVFVQYFKDSVSKVTSARGHSASATSLQGTEKVVSAHQMVFTTSPPHSGISGAYSPSPSVSLCREETAEASLANRPLGSRLWRHDDARSCLFGR